MNLLDKLKDAREDAIKNRKQLMGFALATGGSYLTGLISTEIMRRTGTDININTWLTWLIRTGSFYAINLPYHAIMHKNEYSTGERDLKKEMKTIGFSNAVGTLLTLPQKSAHRFLLKYCNNILAYCIAYGTIGGGAAIAKFGIDKTFDVFKSSRNKNEESKTTSQ